MSSNEWLNGLAQLQQYGNLQGSFSTSEGVSQSVSQSSRRTDRQLKWKMEYKWFKNINQDSVKLLLTLPAYSTYYGLWEKFADNIIHHSGLQERRCVNDLIARRKKIPETWLQLLTQLIFLSLRVWFLGVVGPVKSMEMKKCLLLSRSPSFYNHLTPSDSS